MILRKYKFSQKKVWNEKKTFKNENRQNMLLLKIKKSLKRF